MTDNHIHENKRPSHTHVWALSIVHLNVLKYKCINLSIYIFQQQPKDGKGDRQVDNK